MNHARRLLFVLLFAATLAGAQGYPSKPVKILVPFPPGGSSDLVVRSYTPRLAEVLGQQVIVDYKGGAGGSIGAAEVAKSAPDGYTLLQVWDTHAVNHHVYKVAYDYAKSFEPIALLVQAPGILVSQSAFGPSSVKELVEYARANPGKVTYASSGTGSSNHLSGLTFEQMAGVKMTHVPYKGGGPMITDLLGGHVDVAFGSMPLFEPHVKSGKMKALAVLSNARVAQFPNLAAAAETLPKFEAGTWFGLLAPAGTPRDIVARLQRDVAKALNDPKVKEELAAKGFTVVASTPETFAAFLVEQSETAGRLVRAAGIKPE
jgi:tripartite-type tricarboxylate transporter receptor subunit TctC